MGAVESFETESTMGTLVVEAGDVAAGPSWLATPDNETFAARAVSPQFTAKLPQDASETPVTFDTGETVIRMQLTGLDATASTAGPLATFDQVDKASSVTYRTMVNGIKEDIVLSDAPTGVVQFEYAITTQEGVRPEIAQDGSIRFVQMPSDRTVATIPAGTMVDSAASPQASDRIAYDLSRDGASGQWDLKVTPDIAWLQAPDRQYPVNVDPSLTVPYPTPDCWVASEQPSASFCGNGSNYIRAGVTGGGALRRSLIKFDVSALPLGANITSAEVRLYLDSLQTTTGDAADYALTAAGKNFDSTATWNSAGISGNWQGGSPGQRVTEVERFIGNRSGYKVFKGMASTVQAWSDSGSNPGLVLKQVHETTRNVLFFKSAGSSSDKPKLVIQYTVDGAPEDLQVAMDNCVDPCDMDALGTTVSDDAVSAVASDAGAQLSYGFSVRNRATLQVLATGTSAAAPGIMVNWNPNFDFIDGDRYQLKVEVSDGLNVTSSGWLSLDYYPEPTWETSIPDYVDEDVDEYLTPPTDAEGESTLNSWGSEAYSAQENACWGYYSEDKVVKGIMEWGGYTQCSEPHQLYLYMQLQRLVKKKGSVLSEWRFVEARSKSRTGYILNNYEGTKCYSLSRTTYRMHALPEADGMVIPVDTYSDPWVSSCRIRLK